MITKDLTDFIEKKLNENISEEDITSKLLLVGWHANDIKEGFLEVSQKSTNLSTQTTENVEIPTSYKIDPYREKPEEREKTLSFEDEIIKQETPVINEERIEKKEEVVEKINEDPNQKQPEKIWTPKAIKTILKEDEFNSSPKKETNEQDNKSSTRSFEKITKSNFNETNSQLNNKKIDSLKNPINDVKTELKEEEMIPKLISKTQDPSFKRTENIINRPSSNPKTINQPRPPANNISKSAMIASYSKDLAIANKANELNKSNSHKENKRTILGWLIFILFLFIVGALFFVIKEGYIKVSDIF